MRITQPSSLDEDKAQHYMGYLLPADIDRIRHTQVRLLSHKTVMGDVGFLNELSEHTEWCDLP